MKPARPDTERLFIGVPLPAAAVALVRAAQEALPANQGLRLVHPEQTHVTVAFIGEASVEAREAARALIAGLPQEVAGVTTLGGYLFLPSAQRPRVVALGVDDPSAVFSELFEVVMAGLERARVMRREKRPYRPHVTIARLRAPTDVRPKSECGRVPFPVESVRLYRSELRREGVVYTIMEERTFILRDTIKQT